MTIDIYCHCYHCVPGGGQLLSLLLLLSLSLSIVRLLSSFIYNFVTYHYPCLPGDGLARLALPASALQEVNRVDHALV